VTKDPAMRVAVAGKYCVVLKKDFDVDALYGLDAQTGALLWRSDPKVQDAPKPMYSLLIDQDKVYGLKPSLGRGFHIVCLSAATGKQLFSWEAKDYQTSPIVELDPRVYGDFLVVRLQDNQRFQVLPFNTRTRQPGLVIDREGVGPFGVHGRVSATVQEGCTVLWSQNGLSIGAP